MTPIFAFLPEAALGFVYALQRLDWIFAAYVELLRFQLKGSCSASVFHSGMLGERRLQTFRGERFGAGVVELGLQYRGSCWTQTPWWTLVPGVRISVLDTPRIGGVPAARVCTMGVKCNIRLSCLHMLLVTMTKPCSRCLHFWNPKYVTPKIRWLLWNLCEAGCTHRRSVTLSLAFGTMSCVLDSVHLVNQEGRVRLKVWSSCSRVVSCVAGFVQPSW